MTTEHTTLPAGLKAARLLPVLLCVAGLSLPSSALALQCAAVFPSALQNFHVDGDIDIGKSSQVFGDPDNALETLDLMAYGNLPTCGEQDCVANPALSAALLIPEFPLNLSDEDADHRTVIGSEGFNAYDRVKVKPGRTLNFSNQFDEYLISELKAYPGSRIVLQPGTYWIDKLELNYARVTVAGTGTARLFVNKKARISGSSMNWARPRDAYGYYRRHHHHHHRGFDWDIADAGDPAKLVIVSKDDIEIRKSVVSGLIYAEREASVRYDEAQVLGAVAAKSVSLEKGARVSFDGAAVDTADLSGLCVGFIDSDGDGIEDDIDPDRDGDGVDNEFDAYPDDPERFELGSVEGLQVIPQSGGVFLEWREVTDFGAISGYNIYRQPYGEPEVLIRQVAGDVLSDVDDTVENIRGYGYRVVAVDGNGIEGGAGQQVSVFVAYNQTTVTNLSLSRLGSNASLSWDELPGFSFRIFRGESSLEMTETFEVGGSEYLDTSVLSQQTYFYQIATVIEYTDVFTGETSNLIGPVSEIFELATSGLPEQCGIVFPSALQNHDPRGKIKLKRWVQILNDPDNLLETLELRQETGLPTCGSVFCQALAETTSKFIAPAFPRISGRA